MDIGTAKPDAATRSRIPHLMIDVADPWEAYSAARFVNEAQPHLTTIRPPILVAGTFLYLRALIEGLFEGPSADERIRAELNDRAAREGTAQLHKELATLDPPAALRIHPNDLRRIVRALEVHRLTGIPISTLQTHWNAAHPALAVTYIGIRWEKEALSRRINARVKRMIDAGLVEEVDRLRRSERGLSDEAASAVGYRQLLDYFDRKCSLDDAIEQIKIQTRYLAKMQRTWLKKWPAPGIVTWLDASDGVSNDDLVKQAVQLLQTS
jgi:tRNA dimethylallyltransferase